MKTAETTLDAVQVGDYFGSFTNPVRSDTPKPNRLTSVSKVVKITKTQFILERGVRIYRDNGREVGGSWRSYHQPIAREDALAFLESQRLAAEQWKQAQAAKDAYHASPEYQAASAIRYHCEEHTDEIAKIGMDKLNHIKELLGIGTP